VKTVTIKDAIYATHRSWKKVSTTTIENCWKKVLGDAFEEFEGFEEEQLTTAITNYTEYAKANDIEVDDDMIRACSLSPIVRVIARDPCMSYFLS